MSLVNTVKTSNAYQALMENVRLQWMLVAIIAILCLSIGKTALDSTQAPLSETKTQQALLAKLKFSEQQTIDPQLQEQSQVYLSKLLEVIPEATSISTAEAKTLAEIENLIGEYLINQRMNLLGTEEIKSGSETFWTVRVDVAGQVQKQALVSVLEHFDGRVSNSRLASLQFSPKTADSINLVVDMLYRKQK